MKPAQVTHKKSRKGRNAFGDRRIRVNRAGLHDQAASRLRTLIVRGDLQPGEQLNEAELSQALGVSRTPLREALKLLAAEGLVELRLNRSGVVTPLRRDEINDLFEAVSGIERIAAELAAIRMNRREIQKLKSLQDRMERHHGAGEIRDYFVINQQIHSFIVASCRNNALKATHQWLLARVERARFFALSIQNRWDESVQEHKDILDALEQRDADRAGKLLADHVRRTGQVVNAFLCVDHDDDRVELRAALSA
ncbi:GntR family transcriptional regulator [Bradyrhizobium sp. AZCC 1693]|uniref:GntR family transcriptional regulator n=1 Tax=Bradyrhizobium sp. AZCC 1693 TaxID=3117029 RepID=UPI002FEFA14C